MSMSDFEKKRIEKEFQKFTEQHFESPRRCKNLDQIRFYVRELSLKIEDFKQRFNYVPQAAYTLLAQYNLLQNKMVFAEFKRSYN
ncbi:MAG: hypothetical protein AAFX87_26940 [Bacteroidota bacterium]